MLQQYILGGYAQGRLQLILQYLYPFDQYFLVRKNHPRKIIYIVYRFLCEFS